MSSYPGRARGLSVEAKEVVSGKIFIFVGDEKGISKARFFLDHPNSLLEDPKVAGTPRHIDAQAPYDFVGTAADGKAEPFDTSKLANGRHTVTAAIDYADGTTEVVSTPFIVHNGPPALLFGAEPLEVELPKGGRVSKTLEILTSDGKVAPYELSENAPWLTIEEPVLDPDEHTAPAARTVAVDTEGLEPGTYTTEVTARSADGYASDSQTVTLQVEAASTCSPVPCEEILVDLPYELNFSQDHGKILDKNNVGTGFTRIDQPTNGTGYIPQNLTMNTAAPGTLDVTTTNGLMFTSSDSQDNALAVGIDAPSQVSVLETTLLNPPAASGNFEQGGLWFGNDEDNYVKLDVLSNSGGTVIEYVMEVNGSRSAIKSTGALNLSNSKVLLRLSANPSNRTITAHYQVNGGSTVQLGSFVAPPEFFSFDAAGIDPTIGTRSFGGIYTSHRSGTTPLSYTFDNFSVKAGTAPPPPPQELSFNRSSFPVPFPTSMVYGPDGRLYVTELFGKIHAITLDENKQVVSDQVITTLGSRLTLGITVDPLSTADNVILWVSHSNPSTSNGELNSSTITRLSGQGFTTRQDVITGLPRAIANHAVNSIHFGPDGKLYIAAGGNTGAGAPNTANTEFGTRAEQPLSAALLVADVRAAGFDGTCATPENTHGPSPCDVQVYSSGLRNMYDFAFHSNGSIYGPDNGLGVTGTFPPSPTPPCEGFADTTSWTQGGDNPGEQPDNLVRLMQGKYYGHPNPYRNECVFKDGSYQGVAPLSNYTPPIHNLGMNKSANGTIEYKSDAFNGALKGELLIANYSVGDDITRIKLSADGTSVVQAKQLAGGFSNPLPLAQGPDGTIYVGENGANRVTALVPSNVGSPSDPGSWTTKQPAPAAVLDAGGTALGDKLYMLAGKTSAGHQSNMYIYNPAANSWTSGPPLPGPAVENPAVAAYNGKLYAFGGSTAPFSGAVNNAAVYDPATNNWTPLAPMQTARGGATAKEIGGKIYVVGGMDATGASLASIEVYDPATDTWSTAAPMSTRRDNPGSAAIDGKLYIFGGRTRNADATVVNGTLATGEVYNPATNQWAAIAPMPTGRRTMMVGTLNGRAQVMGGEASGVSPGTFPQNQEYNPVANTWSTLAPMSTPRHGAVAGTINGVVYVAGGGPASGSSFSTVNEAFSFGTTTPPADTTAPTVASVTPADGAIDVAVSTNAVATFSEDMRGATIDSNTFTLTKQGSTTPVNATVSYDGATKKATLDPSTDLDQGATYTATIKGGTNGVKDAAGNALAADKTWSFTTASPSDTTPPETTIGSGPSGTVNNASATFSFTSSETNSTFECSLDGAAFSGCTSPKDYTGLADGQHTFEVRATDAAGNTDATPAKQTWTVDTTSTPVGGLKGDYYDNMDLTSFKLTRTDPTIDFNWGTGKPAPTVGQHTFSVRWSGQIKADHTETYTFHATTDDGVRLWVDNKLIIDRWLDQSATTSTGTVALEAGKWYSIKMEYYDNQRGAVAKLEYSSASTPRQVVPSNHLSPTAPLGTP